MAFNYTHYWHPYSICSLMVRYSLVARGPPKEGEVDWNIDHKVVDIYAGEQISEHFLCDVNPKGQVPVLACPDTLSPPLADSLKITLYIMEHFPQLQPPEFRDEIIRGLSHLHEINYFALSFKGSPAAVIYLRQLVEKDLANPNSSNRYKRALEYKLQTWESVPISFIVKTPTDKETLQRLQDEKISALVPESAMSESQTRSVLADMTALMTKRKVVKGPWLFGTEHPTALDNHLVIFLARLQDVGKDDLIPAELQAFADMAMETSDFKAVFAGVPSGRTVPQNGLRSLAGGSS